ncbi:MAG: hypothetical protein AAF236_05880 [Verrucomicrobiota bacterium]
MKLLAITASIIAIGGIASASNPRGDDLVVGDVDCRTHDFELSPELKVRAVEAREKIIEEGRYGVTRTNPDGIIVSLKVEDDILWITGIGISGGDGSYAVKPTVIPTDIVTTPIRADWYSGELTGYYGRLLRFGIREYGYVFAISEGEITDTKNVRFELD